MERPAHRRRADRSAVQRRDLPRVISGFMIQGGDPLGTGTGGPGYDFDDEIHPELSFNEPYLLAMANAGLRRDPITGKSAGTNGSQFFLTLASTEWLTAVSYTHLTLPT